MSKIKYYYDTETCRYEKYKASTKDVVINVAAFTIICLIFSVILITVFSSFFDLPHIAYIKEQNKELKYYYNIMDNDIKDLNTMIDHLHNKDKSIYRVIMESDPIPETVWNGGTGGNKKYKELLNKNLNYEDLILAKLKQVDELKRKMYMQTKSYDKIMALAKDKDQMLSHIPSIQPVSNKQMTRIASGFGMRLHPIFKTWRMHAGIDFSAPSGTPIYATGDAQVSRVGYFGGYGNQVTLDHGYGYKTSYAHMRSYIVKNGQKVKRGQLIGYVGNTGASTGPHVHYEVVKNGKKVNPIYYIYLNMTDEEYDEILKQAREKNQSLS